MSYKRTKDIAYEGDNDYDDYDEDDGGIKHHEFIFDVY